MVWSQAPTADLAALEAYTGHPVAVCKISVRGSLTGVFRKQSMDALYAAIKYYIYAGRIL
jgi:hypothetical protein